MVGAPGPAVVGQGPDPVGQLGIGSDHSPGVSERSANRAFTCALGVGTALNVPAWQAITPELVSREELPAAAALAGIGFYMARSSEVRRADGHHRAGDRVDVRWHG